MSEPTMRELARRRGAYSMAKNLRRQGCSLSSALRMLIGVSPIPVLTDAVRRVVCQGCDGTGGPSKNCARCRGDGFIALRRPR